MTDRKVACFELRKWKLFAENEEKEGVDLRVSSRSSFRSSVDEDCDLDENQGRLGKSASRSRLRSSVAIMERCVTSMIRNERMIDCSSMQFNE